MSAPDTNIETMERRHRPVLLVLRVLIAGAALALLGFVATQLFGGADAPTATYGEAATFEAGGQASAARD